jgi:NAD(P)-dependent dehydrogenase (short-subunit alcohol dehydrogenase family)/acyl carrier protein
VYLITGGLGNIGLLAAEYLARTVQARLVLLGRTSIPDASQWDEWLQSHPADDPVSRKIVRLRALEDLGSEVMTASVNVAYPDRVREVLGRAEARFGQIHGVIHGAGHTGENSLCTISAADRDACERHLQPKVQGILAIEAALGDKQPDFYLLLSSLSAVLGGLGFGPYASANAFLDALSIERNRQGGPLWMSVNWDGWDFTENATVSDYILPREGVEAFQRLFHGAPRHPVVVSTRELGARVEQWIHLPAVREKRMADEPGAKPSGHARPSLTTAYAAARNPTEETIAGIWEKLLGIEKVGVHDNFFELGGHSLLGIQLAFRLRETFQVDVPPNRLFESPTVAELAEVIERDRKAAGPGDEEMEKLLELVEGMSESEVQQLLAEREKAAGQ